jgi:predicted ATPase
VDRIRTPDQRLRVFVSSTIEELAAERAAVREAIEGLRLTPVLFELGARPHPPRELYRSYLEQSDVFVGIYGDRYGWVAPDMEISGLEDEYRLSGSKPRLLYVKQPADAREDRLRSLIGQIESDGDVSYRVFRTADELGTLLADDLAHLVSERFRPQSEARLRASLPAPVDAFVGRTQVLADLLGLLGDPEVRLVTITGPGGVGKTRLALEAARSQTGLSDGAHFVSLAPVADPELVAEAVVRSLGLPAANAPTQLDALIDGLRDSRLLLVLDNFEHLLPAAAELGLVLEACPQVTALVTTRSVLRLRGERELAVQPLAVPGGDADEPSEATALFVERARAASPGFEVVDENRAAVAEICRRLEGLPLALELAAARVRHLSPRAMLERLEGRLELPSSGGAGYPERQRTMRATLDWSFDLLDAGEQAVFARASAFRGGWTIAAFDEVCSAGVGIDGLDTLASLVDRSLVRPITSETEPRFVALETIREYAAERLELSGDGEATRERHSRFFLDLVAEAGAGLRLEGHTIWLARLDADDDNIRATLRWSLERGELVRVADAAWELVPYWLFREQMAEGRRLLAAVRETVSELPASVRAKVVAVDGLLAFWESDYEAAAAALTEAARGFAGLGEAGAAALAQVPLGVLGAMRGATEPSLQLLEQSRRILEEEGDEWGSALAAIGLGFALNAARADAPLELFEGLVTQAARLGREAETIALGVLGQRRAIRGEHREATETFARALRSALEFRAAVGVRWYLEYLADLAAGEKEYALAVRLSAAAESVFDLSDAPGSPLLGDRDERLALLRGQLGEAFEQEWDAGRRLDMQEAGAHALAWAERVEPAADDAA